MILPCFLTKTDKFEAATSTTINLIAQRQQSMNLPCTRYVATCRTSTKLFTYMFSDFRYIEHGVLIREAACIFVVHDQTLRRPPVPEISLISIFRYGKYVRYFVCHRRPQTSVIHVIRTILAEIKSLQETRWYS